MDIKGEVLCGKMDGQVEDQKHAESRCTNLPPVSQFTLMASTKKGSKPDFHAAARPEIAKDLYDIFIAKVRGLYETEKIKDGVFQAMMDVELINDGPVGIDYRSDDSAVSNIATFSPFDYKLMYVYQVTLEIDTTPPKPAQEDGSEEEESTFEMPASLLE